MYRSIVGKLLWMSPIRPDITYATKELSRHLSEPTEEDMAKVKHLCRYLSSTQDQELLLSPDGHYSRDDPMELEIYVDSDWPGYPITRKSTTGCVVRLAGCTVHHYSRTQGSIAQSTGEAELYAIGSGAAEGVSMQQLLCEAGVTKIRNTTLFTLTALAESLWQ